jgi:hypothetical protein
MSEKHDKNKIKDELLKTKKIKIKFFNFKKFELKILQQMQAKNQISF